jgi:hypothetical protein
MDMRRFSYPKLESLVETLSEALEDEPTQQVMTVMFSRLRTGKYT